MKKSLFVLTLALFATQAAYCGAPPAPVKGVQPAKDDATCQINWEMDSKGKDSVKFVVGGFVGIRTFNKNDYINACKAGTLPAVSAMQ